MHIVNLIFTNQDHAAVFQQWWQNNGRERFEDDIPAIKAEHPAFDGTHTVDGPNGKELIQL